MGEPKGDYARGVVEGKRRFHAGTERPSKPGRDAEDYTHGVYDGWGKAKDMAKSDAASVSRSWPRRVP